MGRNIQSQRREPSNHGGRSPSLRHCVDRNTATPQHRNCAELSLATLVLRLIMVEIVPELAVGAAGRDWMGGHQGRPWEPEVLVVDHHHSMLFKHVPASDASFVLQPAG